MASTDIRHVRGAISDQCCKHAPVYGQGVQAKRPPLQKLHQKLRILVSPSVPTPFGLFGTTGSTTTSTSTSRSTSVQAAPVPPAPQAVHRPAGKHYNHPRGPPPEATNIIDIPHEDELQELLGPNLVDITVDSGKLQVATNVDKREQQLQEDLIKQTIELQDFYEDDLSQYTEDDIKAAIASEVHSLGKKNIYGEVDIDSLTPGQQRRVIKTRWVIGPRPSSTSVDDIDITTVPLKARFVAKGYSQYISDHIKETFAVTPSSTSLRTLILHAVLHQYQVTSCDISSACIFEYADR